MSTYHFFAKKYAIVFGIYYSIYPVNFVQIRIFLIVIFEKQICQHNMELCIRQYSTITSLQYSGMITKLSFSCNLCIETSVTDRLFDIPGYCHLLGLNWAIYPCYKENNVCTVTFFLHDFRTV